MTVYVLSYQQTPKLLNDVPPKQRREVHPPVKSPAGEIRVIEGALEQTQTFSFVFPVGDFLKLIK